MTLPTITQATSLDQFMELIGTNPEAPALIMEDSVILDLVLRSESWMIAASNDGWVRSGMKHPHAFFTVRKVSALRNRLVLFCRFFGFSPEKENGWLMALTPASLDESRSMAWFLGIIEMMRGPEGSLNIETINTSDGN